MITKKCDQSVITFADFEVALTPWSLVRWCSYSGIGIISQPCTDMSKEILDLRIFIFLDFAHFDRSWCTRTQTNGQCDRHVDITVRFYSSAGMMKQVFYFKWRAWTCTKSPDNLDMDRWEELNTTCSTPRRSYSSRPDSTQAPC